MESTTLWNILFKGVVPEEEALHAKHDHLGK